MRGERLSVDRRKEKKKFTTTGIAIRTCPLPPVPHLAPHKPGAPQGRKINLRSSFALGPFFPFPVPQLPQTISPTSTPLISFLSRPYASSLALRLDESPPVHRCVPSCLPLGLVWAPVLGLSTSLQASAGASRAQSDNRQPFTDIKRRSSLCKVCCVAPVLRAHTKDSLHTIPIICPPQTGTPSPLIDWLAISDTLAVARKQSYLRNDFDFLSPSTLVPTVTLRPDRRVATTVTFERRVITSCLSSKPARALGLLIAGQPT